MILLNNIIEILTLSNHDTFMTIFVEIFYACLPCGEGFHLTLCRINEVGVPFLRLADDLRLIYALHHYSDLINFTVGSVLKTH